MERSEGWSDRPVSSWAKPRREAPAGTAVAGDETRLRALVLLLAAEAVAFAALVASGNMPQIVSVLYRALLTL